MFWVQFLNRLGANKLTLFELEPFETAVTSIFNKSESKICTQTRTKLHSKHVIFAPKTCKIAPETWGGVFAPENLVFAPKNSEMFTIFRWIFHNFGCKNIDFRCKNTKNQVQKQWNFHYFCTIIVQKLVEKQWNAKAIIFAPKRLVFAPKTVCFALKHPCFCTNRDLKKWKKKKPKKNEKKTVEKPEKNWKKRRFRICERAKDCAFFFGPAPNFRERRRIRLGRLLGRSD